jgi:hypothetical protein
MRNTTADQGESTILQDEGFQQLSVIARILNCYWLGRAIALPNHTSI